MSEQEPAPRARPRASARAARRRGFSIGSVLSQAFSIWFGNFLPFALLTLIVYAPYIAMQYAQRIAAVEASRETWWAFADAGLSAVCGAVLAATLIHTVFQRLRGKAVGFAESVTRGFSKFAPVLGVSLLVGLVTILAVMPGALLVEMSPGLGGTAVMIGTVVSTIIQCGIYVAVPACVVERVGPIAAIQRSWSLTKGHKGQMFLILVLFGLIVFVGGIVLVGGAAAAAGSDLDLDNLETAIGMPAFLMVLSLTLLSASIQAALSAVVYHDLRSIKEGIGAEDLADVFD